jgi:replicative DNA helicase
MNDLEDDANPRSPPHNLDAEKGALGSVFIRASAFDQIVGLLRGSEDFFLPAHRDIFEAMLEAKKRKRPIDVIEVAEELRTRGVLARLDGGQMYLNDLANSTPTAEHAAHYARMVREKSTLRRLIAACAEVQSSAYGDHGEHEAFVSEAMRKVSLVAMLDQRRTAESLDETFEKLQDQIENVELGKIVSRIPTGIAKLDRLLRGGMGIGHLVVPIGLTSMGKSSLVYQIGFRNAEQRHIHCLIFSLEMSRQEAFIKGAASLSKYPTDLFNVQPGEKADWKKILEVGGRAAALSKYIRIEEHRTIGEIVAVSRAWRAALPRNEDGSPAPAMIGVDHIQKVVGVRTKNGNRQEEVWGVARELKDLAQDLELPVVAPGQMDNDAAKEKRAPRVGDTRDSKAIEHEADLVLGIHRNRMETSGKCELIVLKHRGGTVGKRTVQWEGAWQGFEDPQDDASTDDPEEYGG